MEMKIPSLDIEMQLMEIKTMSQDYPIKLMVMLIMQLDQVIQLKDLETLSLVLIKDMANGDHQRIFQENDFTTLITFNLI